MRGRHRGGNRYLRQQPTYGSQAEAGSVSKQMPENVSW
jgi:hypothetical protein